MNGDQSDFLMEDPIDLRVSSVIESLQKTKSLLSGDTSNIEWLSDWNVIPYGKQSSCKPYLLIYLDEKYLELDVLNRSVELITKKCQDITKSVLIYVNINMEKWQQVWDTHEPQFSEFERQGLKLHIGFRSH